MYTKCSTKTELHSNVTTLHYLILIAKNVKTNYIATKVETELGHPVRLSQLGHALSRSRWSDPTYKYPDLTWVLNLDHVCYYLSDLDQSDELSILDADF